MLTVIAVILVFSLLIISHELGHFGTAKLFGVHVYSFNIGMGPKLFKWRRKETEYTIRLLPIGGSVQMMGEDEAASGEGSFNTKPVWQRIIVIAAGGIMNFVLAIALFVIIFMAMGMLTPTNVIGDLSPGQPAEVAGIQAGDEVININGNEITTWDGIVAAINADQIGQPLDIIVLRDGQEVTVTMAPEWNAELERWMIGIYPVFYAERQNFFSAISLGVRQSYNFTVMLISAIFGMATGQVEPDVGGPVAIVTVIGEAAATGMQTVLLLTAFLSINLAVINLLPLPALDGSRIVFLIIEALRGKPINPEKEAMIHFIGLMALLALIVLVTYNDIMRLLQ